ncbi:MAG: alanine dehydrogenase [Actinomycetota bacterium]|jgi:alanine dehydrogenase|nr:alanine dehydrogenase [Actinomycetota bacterium]
MKVGIPKEVKDHESRVAATPEGVREWVHAGHTVLVETTAGIGSSIGDDEFQAAGATVLPTADAVFEAAEMIVKVKEPQPQEYERFRAGQILFTFLHLAADVALTSFLLEREVTSLAYETVRSRDGRLPLLAPMSEIAGRMAPHVGANCLERPKGGRGVLMGGAAGVAPAKVVVLGAGMAGSNAAWIAAGMEADVAVVDRDIERLRWIDQQWRGRIQTVTSSRLAVERLVLGADVVVGAVLIPGAKAPRLVTAEMVTRMRPGAVLVDISIDQGGCFETSHVTTHSEPTYLVDDVVHYCVGNMPGAVPRTSTYALTNVTAPYVLALAGEGFIGAIGTDPSLAAGVSTFAGHLTNEGVGQAHGLPVVSLAEAGLP